MCEVKDGTFHFPSGLPLEGQTVYRDIYDAFIFYFPVVATEVFGRGTGAVNVFRHAPGIARIADRIPGGVNRDTVYSCAFFDVTEEPVVFERPAVDRFFTLMLFDANTVRAEVMGSGGRGGRAAARYVLEGPGFDGDIPDGYEPVRLRTNLATGVLRINTNGEPEDEEEVRRIQSSVVVRPLSSLGDSSWRAPETGGLFDNPSDSFGRLNHFKVAEFFDLANRLAVGNPPEAQEASIADKFTKYGIGAGLSFSLEQFGDGRLRQAVEAIPDSVRERMEVVGLGNEIGHNGWMTAKTDLSLPGGDLFVRASANHWGIGPNAKRDAAYYTAEVDGSGKPLDGGGVYRIHFEAEALPPIEEEGYWSITAYQPVSLLLIPNDAHRYKVGDLDGLDFNEDGSLDIFVARELPDGASERNWIPSGGRGVCLIFRVYVPQQPVIDDAWFPPALERVD